MNATSLPPAHEDEAVPLGHGAGGRMTDDLLDNTHVLHALGGRPGALEDAALLPDHPDLVISTDGFVVSPLFFPGGDIGSLAVYGTVNDLAMRGARPIALAVALIIEEGFAHTELRAVTRSLRAAALDVGVPIVTGDTKVVGHGAVDKVFITTTGVGQRHLALRPSASLAHPGDAVLLSGPIGLHGTAILSTREELTCHGVASDSRPLHRLVDALAPIGRSIHSLRDPTRGGLTTALNEIARDSEVAVEIDAGSVPVPEAVVSTCDLLGLDPLTLAGAGCPVAFVAPADEADALTALRSLPEGRDAVHIGDVHTRGTAGRVVLRTPAGIRRVIDMPLGEQLPRIY
ncbi:hydrogenase expression/formation protein HypE [Streptomyces sp. NPDC045251]|uniref:hydrogenase expression/formation protein HypE n=1 Tax=unclassified Streptomyces TaxID=2593676 RepID=UPI0033C8C8EB